MAIMTDLIDLNEMLYVEIERVDIDRHECIVEVSFYHTQLKKTIATTKTLFVCRSCGKWMTSFVLRDGEQVTVRAELSDRLEKFIEDMFGNFFI